MYKTSLYFFSQYILGIFSGGFKTLENSTPVPIFGIQYVMYFKI